LAARRALPEDASSRQRLLEESAYDDAAARLKHEWDLQHVDAATASKLAQPTLQKWMWTWFAALTERLESDVKKVIETERKSSRNGSFSVLPLNVPIWNLKIELE
jgi:DNA-directed RNA polymerase